MYVPDVPALAEQGEMSRRIPERRVYAAVLAADYIAAVGDERGEAAAPTAGDVAVHPERAALGGDKRAVRGVQDAVLGNVHRLREAQLRRARLVRDLAGADYRRNSLVLERGRELRRIRDRDRVRKELVEVREAFGPARDYGRGLRPALIPRDKRNREN